MKKEISHKDTQRNTKGKDFLFNKLLRVPLCNFVAKKIG
jgi:hypothetical protein